MKVKYYFRKNEIDFYKWCRIIPRCKYIVKSFSYYSPEMARSRIDEYEEARRIMYQYKVLVATLSDEQRELLKNIIFHIRLDLGTSIMYLQKFIVIG